MNSSLVLVAAALALGACEPKSKPMAPDVAAAVQSIAAQQEAKGFMAEVAKKPGVKVLPSGVAYQIVHSGPATGMRPQLMDEVKVNYEGKLVNGKVFDSSYERGQPAAMPLGGLIEAWKEALQLMRPGDEWILYVPPEKGYGAEGGGDVIPPNAPLIFRIELIGVLPGPGHVANG